MLFGYPLEYQLPQWGFAPSGCKFVALRFHRLRPFEFTIRSHPVAVSLPPLQLMKGSETIETRIFVVS
jgi:hypothetical protein